MTTSKTERRKKTIQRINRIQGQLNGLKTAVESDTECEALVTQTHAIEKAVSSLMLHMIEGYLEHQGKDLVHQNPEEALDAIKRLFELSHR
ncbi:MAG: metal-sensitive transcriptional regulator [Anaerolineae bacterium]|nr:metal-sensitive transcriptional regulator [Anaerolineae bacterium]